MFWNLEPHFDILNGIKQNLPQSLDENTTIQIIVGIEGLPIFKSSTDQFWPILAYVCPNSNKVFPIGIFYSREKLIDSNDFLKEFFDEEKVLIENGIWINNKIYNISINSFCCDAPSKSFILKIKGHFGFFSYSKCEHEGQYLSNIICVSYI